MDLPQSAGYGRAADLADSEAIFKRNFAATLLRGLGIWWHADSLDIAKEPLFRPLLASFQELGTLSLRLENAPGAEIAVMLERVART